MPENALRKIEQDHLYGYEREDFLASLDSHGPHQIKDFIHRGQ